MNIAVTGVTGFVGHYLVRHLANSGHSLRCWHRASSDRGGLESSSGSLEWILGELNDERAAQSLVEGCDAVVHAALYRPGAGFRGAEGDLIEFVKKNVVGSLRLIEAAHRAQVSRFIFVSTCAVHEKILNDRPLDETHPSGVYGASRPPSESKWFRLVDSVARGREVTCERGGKEVHAADVAKATEILLLADEKAVAGQAFNCCDRYISDWDVAHLAKKISGSSAVIRGRQTAPKNQIVTDKLRSLGMVFGGEPLLQATIRELVVAASDS